MRRFDIATMENRYDQRGKDVFYQAPEFKMRVVDLAAGESMPKCDMPSHVVFVCIEGQAEIAVAGDEVSISRGQVFVTEPATLSMSTRSGVRLLGIQIAQGSKE